jgi:hypothetical protein
MKGVDIMINFIKFIIILAIILIAVSLLLDKLMGIFIVCIAVCLLLQLFEREKNHKKPN